MSKEKRRFALKERLNFIKTHVLIKQKYIMQNSKENIKKFVQNRGNVSLMKKMLDDGTITDINVLFDNGMSTNSALMFEVKYGTIEGMKFLLTHNADPNIQDNNGWTALHHAVWNGEIDKSTKSIQLAKVKLLMEYGADKTIKSRIGKTALDIAKGFASCNDCIKVINSKVRRKNNKSLRKRSSKSLRKTIKK